ncbi:MAG: hypothetical protein JXR14_07645 [Paracoccaceae bacterium]
MAAGFRSAIGPLIAVIAMIKFGPQGLFLTTIGAHILMIGFTIWRSLVKAPVAEGEKSAFKIGLPARVATPETAALAGGEEEAEPITSVDVLQ